MALNISNIDLGLPSSLTFDAGLQEWRLDLGGSVHSFLSEEDALKAHKVYSDTEGQVKKLNMTDLKDELSGAGLRRERIKTTAVNAVTWLRFQSSDLVKCTCCAKAGPASQHLFDISRILKDFYIYIYILDSRHIL